MAEQKIDERGKKGGRKEERKKGRKQGRKLVLIVITCAALEELMLSFCNSKISSILQWSYVKLLAKVKALESIIYLIFH